MLGIGIVCFITGLILKLIPTEKPNYLYGYKTKLSMKNQDTWQVAQSYAAKGLMVLGLSYVAIDFILNQILKNVTKGYQTSVFLLGIVVLIIVVESHLRKIFNKDGTRK